MTITRKNHRRLSLRKQSLRQLDPAELGAARGGTNLPIAPVDTTNGPTSYRNWLLLTNT